METDQKDFLLKEFERLRVEMDESVKETRSLERNAVIASGAIWAWALVHPRVIPGVSFYVLLSIPTIIVALSALRAWALQRHIIAMSKYLANVEKAFILPPCLGWERRFDESTEKTIKSLSAFLFWAILLLFTIVGAAVMGCILSRTGASTAN